MIFVGARASRLIHALFMRNFVGCADWEFCAPGAWCVLVKRALTCVCPAKWKMGFILMSVCTCIRIASVSPCAATYVNFCRVCKFHSTRVALPLDRQQPHTSKIEKPLRLPAFAGIMRPMYPRRTV
jgi:hypothetical protein